MTIAELRAKIKTGRPTVGAWLQLPSPDVAEIIGRSGYDWAAVDLEHGAMTRGVLPDLFAEGQGMVALGRMEGGTFMATEVLARHDETYMPKEVVNALKEQGVWEPES